MGVRRGGGRARPVPKRSTAVTETFVFVRRQSPDWAGLARLHRSRTYVDPQRYLPDHEIAGFPPNVDRAIERWNERFRIDYFTARAILAKLSDGNIGSIANAKRFDYSEQRQILNLARECRFVLFFHDDDDFFASDLPVRLASLDGNVDVHVFPLFRVHSHLATFVRDGQPAEFIWGTRRSFDFRFQSNNYGIESGILSESLLTGMKDHVEASSYADAHNLSEALYPFVISATVKTPCSASHLPQLLEHPRDFEREMKTFVRRFAHPDLPAAYGWLDQPLRSIAHLFDAIVRKRRYADLSPEILDLIA
jgi:hypothetical protein